VVGACALLVIGEGAAEVLRRLDAPGPQPEGLASDGVDLWVADYQSGLLYEMETGTGTVLRTFEAPGPRPEGLAWDGSHLWCADWDSRRVYRLAVGESTLTVDRELPVPAPAENGHPVGLAWDGSALWLTTWQPFYLLRLDPVTGTVLRSRNLQDAPPLYPPRVPGSLAPEDLAWYGGQLWITDWYTWKIYRVDPESLLVTETYDAGATASVGLTFHGGRLWNGDTDAPASLFELDVPGPVSISPRTWGGLKSLHLEP
jgi:sugar lactone lactonase YvrE